MRKNSRTGFLPIVMLPALMPAVLLPAMLSLRVPDVIIGASMGFFIGLAIVALFWMAKGIRPGSHGERLP